MTCKGVRICFKVEYLMKHYVHEVGMTGKLQKVCNTMTSAYIRINKIFLLPNKKGNQQLRTYFQVANNYKRERTINRERIQMKTSNVKTSNTLGLLSVNVCLSERK